MKTSRAIIAVLALTGSSVLAQDAPYQVTERGPNHRIWQRTNYVAGRDGKPVPRVQQYTELGSDLCFQSGGTGPWLDAKEEIEILSNGKAQAIQGQHQARFPADIYYGVIEVVGPDGTSLKSRPAGIFFDDGSNTVLLAELKDSIGQLMGSNQVIYPDAFTGIKADLRYIYTKAGFEQEVILREQPPEPESFGLNSAMTRLQLLTEFFNAANPTSDGTKVSSRDHLSDSALKFGALKLDQGHAFFTSNKNQSSRRSGRATVYKNWEQVGNRRFLMEEVPYARIRSQLDALPPPALAVGPPSSSASLVGKLSATRLLPPLRLADRDTNSLQLARADFNGKGGVVLDYRMLDNYWTNGDLTFQSNQTYYLSGYCEMGGTLTVQGGAVVKYAADASLHLGAVICQTGPYNLATFTAKDDNSIGEPIEDSTGNPQGYYANAALDFTWNGFLPSLSYLRFGYAETAILIPESENALDLRHSQLVQCDYGICTVLMYGTNSSQFAVRNVLIDRIGTAAFYGDPFYGLVEHVTISGVNPNTSALAGSWYGGEGCGLNLINCLGRNDVYWGMAVDYGDPIPLSGAGCYSNLEASAFQSLGAGHYYLAANSPYRNAGTNNIDNWGVNGPALLAALQQQTTYPPVWLEANFSTDTSLYPRVQRDTDALDPGYHYDSLDYLTASLTVASGARLALSNGVAVDVMGNNLTIDGTLVAPQQLTNAMVQEQPSAPISVLIGCPPGVAITWDSEHDGLPNWWEYLYFGGYSQTAGGDADGDGVNNLQEYLNGTDPNQINFTVRLGNQHFNTLNPTGSFLILNGVPSYEAVLANDTNLNNAIWTAYDGIVHLNLGATDGVYQVWIGLRSHATNITPPVWMGTEVTLTRTPPQIFITSPATNVIAQPYLQLQGYSALPLEMIRYDLSNAVCHVTNQPGFVTRHTLDTNTWKYTSDYFQCYDLLLTNGLNAITLRVTDPAGNNTTTNFEITLDYASAGNPMIEITWPANGDKLCSDSFTVRGWTEDASAAVAAIIVDTNGNTNTVNGSVERNGKLWVDNLPLAAGSNYVTLSVTNTAGLGSVTNFAVLKSSLILSMSPVGESLWHGYVTVTGYVSDDTQAVWINGVKAVVTSRGNGTADWRATHVPVTEGGVASFDMTAYDPTEQQPDGSYGNGGGN